jgi:C_GCAxxG_C_C family probable redox protein
LSVFGAGILIKKVRPLLNGIPKLFIQEIMTRTEKATLYFANTFNCSQAVFASFGQEYGLSESQCLKIGCAFGGGMARQQSTCGAVSGALMALGLAFGRGIDDQYSKTGIAYEKTEELFEEFKKRNGSITCKELLQGLNMNDPEDMKKIQQQELFKTVCVKYVQNAVEITEKLIERN